MSLRSRGKPTSRFSCHIHIFAPLAKYCNLSTDVPKRWEVLTVLSLLLFYYVNAAVRVLTIYHGKVDLEYFGVFETGTVDGHDK